MHENLGNVTQKRRSEMHFPGNGSYELAPQVTALRRFPETRGNVSRVPLGNETGLVIDPSFPRTSSGSAR